MIRPRPFRIWWCYARLTASEDPRALGLPDEVWRRLGSGSAKLVLDISGEGMAHTEARASGFHRFMQAAGVDPANCVYITQDRGFAADYAAHRHATGRRAPDSRLWSTTASSSPCAPRSTTRARPSSAGGSRPGPPCRLARAQVHQPEQHLPAAPGAVPDEPAAGRALGPWPHLGGPDRD